MLNLTVMQLLGNAFFHTCIYSLNIYLFTICQGLCNTLENKDKKHVLYFQMVLQNKCSIIFILDALFSLYNISEVRVCHTTSDM